MACQQYSFFTRMKKDSQATSSQPLIRKRRLSLALAINRDAWPPGGAMSCATTRSSFPASRHFTPLPILVLSNGFKSYASASIKACPLMKVSSRRLPACQHRNATLCKAFTSACPQIIGPSRTRHLRLRANLKRTRENIITTISSR